MYVSILQSIFELQPLVLFMSFIRKGGDR